MLECVEWICTDTARWMKIRFRYAEADNILAQVNAAGFTL
jgi:hypothetical protein